MATGAAPNTNPLPTTAYSLRSIYLGAPLQGDAASPGFSLQLLGGKGHAQRRLTAGRRALLDEHQDREGGPAPVQLLEQVHADDTPDAQAADQELTSAEQIGGRQRAGSEGNAVTVPAQGANDQVGRGGVIVGNGDALPGKCIPRGGDQPEPRAR